MRRTLASLLLAALVAVPAVAPVAAGGPGPNGTAGTGQPSRVVPPSPEATPAASPTSAAPSTPAPTADPATTSPPPTADPATTSPPPTADPATTSPPAPAPTATTTDATPTPAPTATATDPMLAPAATSPAAGRPDTAATTHTTGRPDTTGRFIVVLKGDADPAAVETRHRQREGVQPIRTFRRVVDGFTAHLDAKQKRALLADPNVAAVVPDEVVEVAGQITPTGVARIGTRYSTTAKLDGLDQRVDADVAIVDTGIAKHPDLNVVGGYNCSTSDKTLWRDVEGHGTHVAGTVGALDNDFGVVGVAPGARLWAVKILNDDGYGLLSWYVCGLDWILSQRDPTDASRPLFEAANMSVTKWGADDHACGTVNDDILHAAICRVVAGGITVVAAAANDSGSAAKRIPASYNEVITVSALADTDGKAGGVGGPRCYSWGTYDKDDTFADFSNYGGDVDIMAPGKCIWSTIPGGYGYSSGTSMAAPAVTGAVALYKSTRPLASPAEVKEALQYLGNYGWALSTDPDSHHEKLLDVSRVAKLGSFELVPSLAPKFGEAGGTYPVPVAITRTSTFFERVRFAVTSTPAGWSAAFATPSLLGWGADATNLAVTVPRGTPAGTYAIGITASNQGRVRTATVSVTVTNDIPTAQAPTATPAKGESVAISSTGAVTSLAVRVSWPAATDPTSPIAGYQVERRADAGGWTGTTALPGGTRTAVFKGLALASVHRFRVRAQDAAGNWSPWVESIAYGFRAVSDRSSTVTYAGTWARADFASATNHVRTSTTRSGATASTTFTGSGIALVMPRSKVRGKLTITVDGVKVATVDTYSSIAQSRRIVWAKRWDASGSHRLVIRASGTSGRPLISLDGLIITK